jgi:hypothetical protein
LFWIGVVSVAVLFAGFWSGPPAPPSTIETVLAICVTPPGNGSFTFTAKVAVPLAPTGRSPTSRVNTPTPSSSHAELKVLLKVVLAGSVSVIKTPLASCVPTLVKVI